MENFKKFTRQDVDNINFREKIFMDELKKYEDFTIGGGASILPFVRDNKGKYSEKKTWQFIRELTWYANTYVKIINQKVYDDYILQGISSEDAKDMVGGLDEFTKEQLEYLQSYLYCVIRIEELNAWRNTGGMTQTFNGFLKYTEEIYGDFRQYFGDLADWEIGNMDLIGMKGLYGVCSWLRYQLTGEFLTDRYTEKTQREYMKYMTQNVMYDEMKDHGFTPTQYRKWREEMFSDMDEDDYVGVDYDGNISESWDREKLAVYNEKLTEENNLRLEETERVKTSFKYKEEFMKQYDIFVKSRMNCVLEGQGSFTDEEIGLINMHSIFPEIIKEAVRLFTIAHNLSFLQNDDGFFTSVGLLRQSAKRLEKMYE